MFDPKTIQFLWQYMVHADGEILAAAATVTDDAYHRDLHISQGTIHRQLVHGFESQAIWLDRVSNVGPGTIVDPATVKRDEVAARWAAVHERLLRFAAEQTPESLKQIIRSQNKKAVPFTLPRGVCMLHVSDHATYHRGQINSMIKHAGGVPSHVMLHTYGFTLGLGTQG